MDNKKFAIYVAILVLLIITPILVQAIAFDPALKEDEEQPVPPYTKLEGEDEAILEGMAQPVEPVEIGTLPPLKMPTLNGLKKDGSKPAPVANSIDK